MVFSPPVPLPTVTCPQRFDALSAVGVDEAIAEHLAAGCDSVAVDLSAVGFIDSAALAALVRGMKACRGRGGELWLVGTRSEEVGRILELTRFDQVFSMVEEGSVGAERTASDGFAS